jgi:hypothetical protein
MAAREIEQSLRLGWCRMGRKRFSVGATRDRWLQSEFGDSGRALPIKQATHSALRARPSLRLSSNLIERTDAMQNPSKVDCITILSAARELSDDALLHLDARTLGLTRNAMETAAAFLIERACFKRHRDGDGQYAVGGLSLQGKLRLEQFVNG